MMNEILNILGQGNNYISELFNDEKINNNDIEKLAENFLITAYNELDQNWLDTEGKQVLNDFTDMLFKNLLIPGFVKLAYYFITRK